MAAVAIALASAWAAWEGEAWEGGDCAAAFLFPVILVPVR